MNWLRMRGTRHGVEHKLDVGVASFDSTGAANWWSRSRRLYTKHIARDLRSLLHPSSAQCHCQEQAWREGDRWVDFLGAA